jgi:hypothetical protein
VAKLLGQLSCRLGKDFSVDDPKPVRTPQELIAELDAIAREQTLELGMPVHPVCEIVPLMGEEALARLVEDIRENGLRVPLVTHNGMLVDGRNRLIACHRAGVAPRFQPWDGRGSLVKFAWSMNGARRDLTPSQRAAAAVLMLPILEQEAAARMRATQGRPTKEKLTQKVESVSDRNAAG